MAYKKFALLKLLLIIVALGLAIFLAFGEKWKELTPDHKIIFVLDINRTMNTKDMLSWTQNISRIQAAKTIIQKTILSEPGFSYGLILFNASIDYILPPTFDTWTFLLYLSWITTNLLPAGNKNFAQLSWILCDNEYASYLVFSDFDAKQQQGTIQLPPWTLLLWLWSLAGDYMRNPNGIRYYDKGKSVSSVRNDQVAQSLHGNYIPLSQLSDFSTNHLLFQGFSLPLSQRIFLYTLLWVLVILIVFL